MIKHGLGITIVGLTALLCLGGCASHTPPISRHAGAWHESVSQDDPATREVTVVIALSSILPGGVIGHAGVAVDEQYWDFGPRRVERFQQFMAFSSEAGPWWDDPEQDWATDRTLAEVMDAMPEKLHPAGSLVAVFRAEVTGAQADAIAGFWAETYARMRDGEDRYRVAGRQCASMVGWSLSPLAEGEPGYGGRLPREMRYLTPTRLYARLSDTLCHTAGPDAGAPADLTLWQLGPEGIQAWHRPVVWSRLGVPELPRTRLAIERVKHLPAALVD